MIRRPPRSTQGVSSAASDVYKRQVVDTAPTSTKRYTLHQHRQPVRVPGCRLSANLQKKPDLAHDRQPTHQPACRFLPTSKKGSPCTTSPPRHWGHQPTSAGRDRCPMSVGRGCPRCLHKAGTLATAVTRTILLCRKVEAPVFVQTREWGRLNRVCVCVFCRRQVRFYQHRSLCLYVPPPRDCRGGREG